MYYNSHGVILFGRHKHMITPEYHIAQMLSRMLPSLLLFICHALLSQGVNAQDISWSMTNGLNGRKPQGHSPFCIMLECMDDPDWCWTQGCLVCIHVPSDILHDIFLVSTRHTQKTNPDRFVLDNKLS